MCCFVGQQNNLLYLKTFNSFLGKSPAIKLGVSDPTKENPICEKIISTSTSSGLTKFLAKQKSVFIVNQEISEYIMKLFKNDEKYTGK